MTWPHVPDDPFINVISNPIYNNPSCGTRIRQDVQALMAEMSDDSPTPTKGGFLTPKTTTEIKPCRVCSKLSTLLSAVGVESHTIVERSIKQWTGHFIKQLAKGPLHKIRHRFGKGFPQSVLTFLKNSKFNRIYLVLGVQWKRKIVFSFGHHLDLADYGKYNTVWETKHVNGD